MVRKFMGTLVVGLTALLPLTITIAVFVFLASYIYAWFGPASTLGQTLISLRDKELSIPLWFSYPLLIIIAVALIWVVGYFARQFIGKKIGEWFEAIIARIPFINKVYHSVDQVVELFRKKDGDAAQALSNVVLMRYANTRMLGMLASDDRVVVEGVAHYMVYVPSSPVPTTGFNYLVPCEEVLDVDITVEEMTRIIVSLGSLAPRTMNAKTPLVLPPKYKDVPAGTTG
jgi:uncharacterized membrane protein